MRRRRVPGLPCTRNWALKPMICSGALRIFSSVYAGIVHFDPFADGMNRFVSVRHCHSVCVVRILGGGNRRGDRRVQPDVECIPWLGGPRVELLCRHWRDVVSLQVLPAAPAGLRPRAGLDVQSDPPSGPPIDQRRGDQLSRRESYSNSGALQPGITSGRPSLTRSGKLAGRFSRKAVMPSTASADWPRATMPRESARWASIG